MGGAHIESAARSARRERDTAMLELETCSVSDGGKVRSNPRKDSKEKRHQFVPGGAYEPRNPWNHDNPERRRAQHTRFWRPGSNKKDPQLWNIILITIIPTLGIVHKGIAELAVPDASSNLWTCRTLAEVQAGG